MTHAKKPRRLLTFGTAMLFGASALLATGAYAGSNHKGWLSEYEYHADKSAMSSTQPSGDIVDTAVSAGAFNTLVTAVKAAGLVDVLKGDGPFTVFAPTDAAFAKLPQGTLEALLADKDQLVKVLTYHVVPGRLEASDVVGMKRIRTVEGSELTIGSGAAGAMVDAANIIQTDIATRNGIIHVIDTVVLPSGS
ncbi:MAG: hypothetical protein Kow006_18440 [Gammaproteobacteria bacterium]